MGENTLALRVDRPGIRRGEVVKLAVPVSYRIGADVTPMSDPRPQILIRAQAIVGSDITIDGKHVPLDGDGTGTYVLDETDAAEGPADESKLLAVDVPYVIVPKGAAPAAAERGTVSARVPISPLRVDSPRGRLVTEDDHIVLAGRAPKGATVKIDSAPVVSSPDGAFEATLPHPPDDERTESSGVGGQHGGCRSTSRRRRWRTSSRVPAVHHAAAVPRQCARADQF